MHCLCIRFDAQNAAILSVGVDTLVQSRKKHVPKRGIYHSLRHVKDVNWYAFAHEESGEVIAEVVAVMRPEVICLT